MKGEVKALVHELGCMLWGQVLRLGDLMALLSLFQNNRKSREE